MTVRDAFPPIRELPAMCACYAVVLFGAWALMHHDKYRALVLDIVGRASFWQILCAGLLLFTIAAAYTFYRTEKEEL